MPRSFVALHRQVRAAACLIGALSLLSPVLAGCGSGEEAETATAASDAAAAPTQSEILERIKDSTVEVNADDGDYHSHGTGIIVDAQRNLVLTSGHVVDAARSLKLTIGEDAVVKGRVVARAQCENLALIALFPEQKGLIELPMADSNALAPGDAVYALSYSGLAKTPEGKEKLAITSGRVSVTGASTQLTDLLPAFEPLIVHQAPLTPSSTGSPLVDEKGQWVGVNMVVPEEAATRGAEGIYYATPTARVKELLDELSPGETSFFAGWEKYHACHRTMGQLAQAQQVVDHDLPNDARPRRGGGHAQH